MNHTKARLSVFRIARWAVLSAFLGFVTWEFYAHSHVDKVHPSVHSICPLGGLESLLRWVAYDGATLQKIFSGTMALFFLSLALSLVFKRAFCGSLCPLGALQDIFGALGARILGSKRPKPPRRLDRSLRLLKYPVLLLTIVMAWTTGTLWIQAFDPWPAYAHIFAPDELFPTYAVGLGILGVSLMLSFLFERAFCKYLCPMGALTALTGLLSPFRARRDAGLCVDCSLCDKACPVNLEVSQSLAVTDAECLSCGSCAAACPVPKALDMGYSQRVRLPPFTVPAAAAAFFIAGVLTINAAGYGRTSGRQEPNLRELAARSGRSPAEFRGTYGLPWTVFPGTSASALEDSLPFAKMAELNGRDPAELKAEMGLPEDLSDSIPWGKAFDQVLLGRVASLNGMSFDEFKAMLSLPEAYTAETTWRRAKRAIEKAAREREGSPKGP